MNFVLFIIVLGALIFVHELGHFLVAKKCGMRVDEFGLGFPPRVFGKKIGETIYSLNWIPFGGFVKIFGENPSDSSDTEHLAVGEERSFNKKNRGLQAAVLVAGVSFNIIFAWLVISASFVSFSCIQHKTCHKQRVIFVNFEFFFCVFFHLFIFFV